MSALAMPITHLMPAVDQAKEKTKRVVACSSKHPDPMVSGKILWKMFELKFRLFDVARRQENLIALLVERDFSNMPVSELRDLATSLDRLVAHERELLAVTRKLRSGIRDWWKRSLFKLSDQVEHLDSIAESLHLETDEQASKLLSLAVEEFATK